MKKTILNFLLKELEVLLKDTADHGKSASYGVVENEIQVGDDLIPYKAEYSFRARRLKGNDDGQSSKFD